MLDFSESFCVEFGCWSSLYGSEVNLLFLVWVRIVVIGKTMHSKSLKNLHNSFFTLRLVRLKVLC